MTHTLTEKIVNFLPNLDRLQLESHLKSALQREDFLQMILDSLNEGILAIDAAGKILFANESVYSFIGLKSEDTIGKDLDNILKDHSLRQYLFESDHDAHLTFEVKVQFPRQLTLMVQIVPLPESPENINQICLILFRDISYEKLSYVNRERQSQLETSRLLTAGIAHEIGNPLSAIILHTQLMGRLINRMRTNSDTRELQRINSIIGEESSRLKRIIADYLNAVRPLSIKLDAGNLAVLLESVFELLYSELNDKNIALIKSFDKVNDFLFDHDQLRSVFINIIRNAMDAMPKGGTLSIAMRQKSNWVEITFKDDGEGIDDKTQTRIFEPFFTTKNDGSGLGLLISQRIIQAHGGLISVKSVLEQGTQFLVELPLRLSTSNQPLPSPKN